VVTSKPWATTTFRSPSSHTTTCPCRRASEAVTPRAARAFAEAFFLSAPRKHSAVLTHESLESASSSSLEICVCLVVPWRLSGSPAAPRQGFTSSRPLSRSPFPVYGTDTQTPLYAAGVAAPSGSRSVSRRGLPGHSWPARKFICSLFSCRQCSISRQMTLLAVPVVDCERVVGKR